MNSNIKVSVIIPVYNVELYLRQCLDSIINQTLTDIEIICVDDGSTDASLDILREYEQKDPRVKAMCQQNKYAGVARNNGMSVASGEYYVFLDSDDFFEPDLLESQYNQIKETGADVSICGGDKYDIRTGEYLPANHFLNVARIKALVGSKKAFTVEDVGDMIFSIASPAPWNKMFSAEFVKKHQLQFMGTQRANDSFFVQVSLNLAEKITYVDKILVHYRVGMTTNLQANNSTSPFDFCHALEAIKDRLIEEGKYDRVKKGFINNVLSQFEYSLSTLENKRQDAYIKLANRYRKEYIYKFELDDKTRDYFYDKGRYNRMKSKMQILDEQELNESYTGYEKISDAFDNENPPEVSVVIPVYNVEPFLKECLDSILNQTITNTEIICVNDGSTDGSVEILKEYAEKYNNITVISQYNQGQSAARNNGMRYAKGEYIYFLDSDDYILPHAFETLIGHMKEKNLDIIMFGAESFFDNKDIKKANMNYMNYYKREQIFDHAVAGDVMFRKLLDKNLFRCSVPLQFFNRKFLMDTKIWFKEGIIHEDELFSALVLVKAERTFCITDALYMRRVRGDSTMTSNATAKRFEAKYIVYTSLTAELISSNNLSVDAKYSLMKQAEKMRSSSRVTYRQLNKGELAKLGATLPEEYRIQFEDIQELKKIKSSWEYRFAMIVMFIPNKLRSGVQCYKDNGLKYTIYRFLDKLKKLIKI